MLKIGEFSKLTRLTVKALRFYEEKGLLLPARVDPWTGYRYYDGTQLETAARIKALRQLDFSLEQIRVHLEGQPLEEALAAAELLAEGISSLAMGTADRQGAIPAAAQDP